MAEEIEELAKLFGAEIVGQVPDVGGGALGAAHLAAIFKTRMADSRTRTTPELTAKGTVRLVAIPVSPTTEQALAQIAEWVGGPDRRADAAELAGDILETFVPLLNKDLRRPETEPSPAETVDAETQCIHGDSQQAIWRAMNDIRTRMKAKAQTSRPIAS